MSFTEQEKERALAYYDEVGSIGKVIKQLGYPSRQNMYTWIKNRNIEKRRKMADCRDLPEHRRHPDIQMKLDILHRCFEQGEDIKSISEETGYSRSSIYSWRRKLMYNKQLKTLIKIMIVSELQQLKSEVESLLERNSKRERINYFS